MENKKEVIENIKAIKEACNEHLKNLENNTYSEEDIVGWPAHFSQVLQDVKYPDL